MLTELCFGTNKAMIKRKNKGKPMEILLAMTINLHVFSCFTCFFMFLKARIADSSPKTIEQKEIGTPATRVDVPNLGDIRCGLYFFTIFVLWWASVRTI